MLPVHRGNKYLYYLFYVVEFLITGLHLHPVRNGTAVNLPAFVTALSVHNHLRSAVHGETSVNVNTLLIFLKSNLTARKIYGITTVSKIKINIVTKKLLSHLQHVGTLLEYRRCISRFCSPGNS